MKHPYYDMTTEKALDLARDLKHGPLPPPKTPLPTIAEGEAIIQAALQRTDFNWITGRAAWEILQKELHHDYQIKP